MLPKTQALRLASRYELQRALAIDGARRVWRAYDHLLDRLVVIKGVFSGGDEDSVLEEFHRLRRFSHPRIAQAFDLARAEWRFDDRSIRPIRFFTQEWIAGASLRDLHGRLSLMEIRRCLTQLLEVVAFLHLQRLTRLDLKPAHILQGETGWRLIDLDQARRDNPLDPGELHGTLPYLAPEILGGSPGGPQSDLYSVGAILFEALTGGPPQHQGSTLDEVYHWLRSSPPPRFPLALTHDAPDLVDLATRLLARSPSDRPVSAEEALKMLDPGGLDWRAACPLPPGPQVGRKQPLAEIEELEREIGRERGGGVAVVGPPRAGHSEFLAGLAHQWQAAGRPALLVSYAALPPRPLGGLELVLRFLAGLGGDITPQDLELPSPPADSSPDDARELCIRWAVGRLREAAIGAMGRDGSPIPILLDDPQELDDLSRAVFNRLRLFLAGSGLMLIVACKEQGGDSEWAQGLPRVQLPPLSNDQIRLLAEDVLGAGALGSSTEVEQLRLSTEGIVGWVRDALTIRWRNPSASISSWSPADHERLATVILGALPPGGAQLARAASVFDHPFTPSLLSVMPAEGDRTTLLCALVDTGLLQSQTEPLGRESTLRFAREGFRRALEATLPAGERAQLHRLAARAMERQSHLTGQQDPNAIARHFLAAGSPEEARPYLLQAVESAVQSLCLDEARGYLRQLISVTPADDSELCRLYHRVGGLELALGNFEAAAEALETALNRGTRLTAMERAGIMADLATSLANLSKLASAQEQLEAALASSQHEPGVARVPWWHLLAWVCMEGGNRDRAREALVSAEAEGIPAGSRLEVDQAHLHTSLALRSADASGISVESIAEVLRLARELKYSLGETKLLNCLVQACRLRGDWEGARTHLEQVIGQTRAEFNLLREAIAVHNLGLCLREADDRSGSLEQFRLSARLYARLGNRVREAQNLLTMADVMLESGKLDRAEETLRRVAAMIEPEKDAWNTARLAHQMLTARLEQKRGELQGLEPRLARLQKELAECNQPVLLLETLADRMSLALTERRPADALILYAEVLRNTRLDRNRPVWRRIYTLAGEAQLALAPPPRADSASVSREHSTPRDTASEASAQKRHAGPDDSTELPGDPAVRTVRNALADAVVNTDGWREFPRELLTPSSRDNAGGRVEVLPNSRLVWLDRIKHLVAVADEDEPLAAELAALAGEMLDGRGLVFLFDGSRPQVVRSYRIEGQLDDISSTLIEWVRAHRRPYICPDIRVDSNIGQLRSLREAHVRSVICVPVTRENACLGVVYVDHREVGRVAEQEAVRILEQIAELTGDLLAGIARRRRGPRMDAVSFGLVGTSKPMMRLKAQLAGLAESTARDLVVLLLGETGTGKSVIARALHQHGRRHSEPFVPVNSPGIPETLFESLMFGYVKGAFTGASESRAGWFEMARGGTLFLDEIGEMPLAQQVRLLVTLGGTKKFSRLGDTREQELDVHLICATSRDLMAEVAAGQFRPELLRRIKVNTCKVPSLRERGPEDIRLLACHLITRTLINHQLLPPDAPLVELEDYFTRKAQDALYEYHWPWNVGEMENLFRNEGIGRQLRAPAREREKIDLELVEDVLGQTPRQAISLQSGGLSSASLFPQGLSYRDLSVRCETLKATYIREVHRDCQQNVRKSAQRLRCTRDVVYKYLGKDEIE